MLIKRFKEGFRNARRLYRLEQYTKCYIRRLKEEKNMTSEDWFEIATSKMQDDEEYLLILSYGRKLRNKKIELIAYIFGALFADIVDWINALVRYVTG